MNEQTPPLSESTETACQDFLHYRNAILSPAAHDLNCRISNSGLQLHHAVQMTMLAAHTLDYLLEIRKTLSMDDSRSSLANSFDEQFAIDGARIQNKKFQLVNGINNAIKHINLDPERSANKDLVKEYGALTFRCLHEDNGVILFECGQYRFDYARVVLRRVLDVIVSQQFEDVVDVADFARGGHEHEIVGVVDESDDPIDQMIHHCNPDCLDCGQDEETCRCSEFLYAGESGEFQPDTDPNFDFDSVMSRISGAYRRES